jgi:uracil-DNA glycosylase family 4
MSHLNPHGSDADQLFQKYLDRAIEEINDLTDQMSACGLCEHDTGFAPVVGTGHPLADVFMLKYSPRPEELSEGVTFFGRSGEAILAAVQRLNMNPIDLYGTNCIKCSAQPTPCQAERCPSWLSHELRIVGPKLVVVMGERAREAFNGLGIDDATEIVAETGRVQRWTHTCQAVYCPDIDESLDHPAAKQEFWDAFRVVGEWYAARPPW